MPDDELKIRLTTPGSREAQQQLRGVTQAEGKVGRAGKAAGGEAAKGADQARGAFDRMGSRLGVNLSEFANWKLGAIAAIAAVANAVGQALGRMADFNRELRTSYRQFVDLSRQAETVQLAGLRHEAPAETVQWARKMAEQYAITPAAGIGAAFELESALPGALGREAFPAAAQLMTAQAVSGKTAAGLAIAAEQAGVGATAADIKRFYGQVVGFAQGARVSPQQVGAVAGPLLPAAVTAGIPVEYFLAQVAAMSMRIKEPGRLRTAIEQMIRAAGQPSAAIEAAGAAAGRPLRATEIMELQGRILAEAMKAGGPQAATAAAEALGIPAEIGSVYAKVFDPTVQAGLHAMLAEQAGATWETVVAPTYKRVRESPETAEFVSRTAAETAEFEASRGRAFETILANRVRARMAAFRGRGGWRAAIPEEQLRYMMMAQELRGELRGIPTAEAQRLLGELGGLPPGNIGEVIGQAAQLGIPEDMPVLGRLARGMRAQDVTAAAQYIQNQYGTIYNIQDRTDPAGKPLLPAGAP